MSCNAWLCLLVSIRDMATVPAEMMKMQLAEKVKMELNRMLETFHVLPKVAELIIKAVSFMFTGCEAENWVKL